MNEYNRADAIILCGGLGTRLKSIQPELPKILTPIGDLTLLDKLITQITRAGLNRVILSLGHLSEKVIEYVDNIDKSNIEIIKVIESKPLGTGGALKLASLQSKSDHVLVINGDSYTDINPSDLLQFHVKHNSSLTMLVVRVVDSSRYGSVLLDSSCLIKSFQEKSTNNQGEHLVNAGMYVIDQSILGRIEVGRAISLERDIFPELIGDQCYGYKSDSKFLDIGTPDSFSAAEQFFSELKS
tara:strand:- start:4987 stop:5709 length:723 start_codon:yes stop_codon:yes gene_type:complete